MRKKSLLSKILIALVVLIAIFFGIASVQPDEFNVTRTQTMTAPPDRIFEQVNNLHNWENWSPWAKLDPNAKTTFEGAGAGTGAVMAWDGNMEVGKGRMTIVDSRPNELVRFQLDFEKPFPGTNAAEFTVAPQGDMTRVTWSMSGKKNLIAKAIGLIMNCDKMIGENFEKGLGSLKAVVEAR